MDASTSRNASVSSSTSTGSNTSPTQSYVPPPPPPPAPGADETSSTDGFLRDLNLVAEAAKRAQMAVLMRDMGDLGFS